MDGSRCALGATGDALHDVAANAEGDLAHAASTIGRRGFDRRPGADPQPVAQAIRLTRRRGGILDDRLDAICLILGDRLAGGCTR